MARGDGNMNRIGRNSGGKVDARHQVLGEPSGGGRDVEKGQICKNPRSPLDRFRVTHCRLCNHEFGHVHVKRRAPSIPPLVGELLARRHDEVPSPLNLRD